MDMLTYSNMRHSDSIRTLTFGVLDTLEMNAYAEVLSIYEPEIFTLPVIYY
jgi:hypothetical protein